ncbi:hypothetical protein HAALTHF_07320n [Vreelandella aquamarina]|nr:hypothetical protein HAALTHF_07320n [Halomonas axialensis]
MITHCLPCSRPYQLVDGLLDVEGIHGRIQQPGVDTQLLVGTDPETVGGHQGHGPGTVAHHKACRKLRSSGRFTHPSGANQCDDARLIKEALFVLQHVKPCH